MTIESLVPAAQYLRVSTDRQEYSLNNQAEAIARYAVERGFAITKTYTDAAKSGLLLKNRSGLKKLLTDVVEGTREYRAVLVYDVSRWGRFQDADESAHYEYMCKSAGAPIFYCAEMFGSDNSTVGLLMKTLKRTMAAEYSRELSVKVRAGLVRLTRTGFKPGGRPAYGLRRMLLDVSGNPKRLLCEGERKCVATERVVLVPGPSAEVAVVRRVFHEFVEEHRSLRSIATRLNSEGVPFLHGATWTVNTIANLLKQRNYIGTLVWGRTTALLGNRVEPMPAQDWVVYPNAFEAIIDQGLFRRAQEAFSNLTCHLSDEDLLDRLRSVLNSEGRLNSEIIQKSRSCPGLTTYHKRIGGLLRAYQRLGYLRPDLLSAATSRQRLMLIRSELINDLVKQSSGQFQEFRPTLVHRALLKQRRTGLLVSVVLARCYAIKNGSRWIVEPPIKERKRMTVLALLNEWNTSIKEIRVFHRMPTNKLGLRVGEKNEWLSMGEVLHHSADLRQVISTVRSPFSG